MGREGTRGRGPDTGTDLRVDREAQAPLVGNDEGDDGIQDGGEQRVDAEDQGTKLFRERRRDLKAEGESRPGSASAARDQGSTRALKARGAAGQKGRGKVGARCSCEPAQGPGRHTTGVGCSEPPRERRGGDDVLTQVRTGQQMPHGGGGGGAPVADAPTGCLCGMSTCGDRAAL